MSVAKPLMAPAPVSATADALLPGCAGRSTFPLQRDAIVVSTLPVFPSSTLTMLSK